MQSDNAIGDSISQDGRLIVVQNCMPGGIKVFDDEALSVVRTVSPGRGVLHMEFTPRGEAVWLSVRDDDRVTVYDTRTLKRGSTLGLRTAAIHAADAQPLPGARVAHRGQATLVGRQCQRHECRQHR
ncbi:cytochrome D1 domain-containing protein [Achromobacter aegrifaciens]